MRKKYVVPAFEIERFHVENIMDESTINNVLRPAGIMDTELNQINLGDGDTLHSIDYRSFKK